MLFPSFAGGSTLQSELRPYSIESAGKGLQDSVPMRKEYTEKEEKGKDSLNGGVQFIKVYRLQWKGKGRKIETHRSGKDATALQPWGFVRKQCGSDISRYLDCRLHIPPIKCLNYTVWLVNQIWFRRLCVCFRLRQCNASNYSNCNAKVMKSFYGADFWRSVVDSVTLWSISGIERPQNTRINKFYSFLLFIFNVLCSGAVNMNYYIAREHRITCLKDGCTNIVVPACISVSTVPIINVR